MDTKYSSERIYEYTHNSFGCKQNPDYIPGCKRTRLIQRIKFREREDRFQFCYMGSSEFEMCSPYTVWAEMIDMALHGKATLSSLYLCGPPSFPYGMTRRYDSEGLEKIKKQLPLLEASVLVLCSEVLRPHITEVVEKLAMEERGDHFLQEPSYLRHALFSNPQWFEYERESDPMSPEALIELDNGALIILTKPVGVCFCERILNMPFPENSIQSADFTGLEGELKKILRQEDIGEKPSVKKNGRHRPSK